LFSHKEELDAFVNQLDDRIKRRIQSKWQKKPLTQLKPFNLTKLKPITLSLPVVSSSSLNPEPKKFSLIYLNRYGKRLLLFSFFIIVKK